MTPAEAFIQWGSFDNWAKNAAPTYSIGFTLGAGSWPVYDGTRAKGWRVFWRNPDTSNGDLWFQTGRFGTISKWFPRQTGNWWNDIPANLAALRSALVIPWDNTWSEVGGTQQQSADNGFIVQLGDTAYELQGMAPLNTWTAAAVNARTFMSGLPKVGDYRADGINYNDGTTVPQGSQGPWSKLDGLMRPSWLRGP